MINIVHHIVHLDKPLDLRAIQRRRILRFDHLVDDHLIIPRIGAEVDETIQVCRSLQVFLLNGLVVFSFHKLVLFGYD